jgi:hypothetical protein
VTNLSLFLTLSAVRGVNDSIVYLVIVLSSWRPIAVEDARAVMTKGLAIITQDTIPRSTVQKESRSNVIPIPVAILITAVRYNSKEISRPTWTATYSMYKKAGGHRDSMKSIFTLFTFIR